MTNVTLYSGSIRQGVREHIEAYQELIRAVDSKRFTIDSCSLSKYQKRQSHYIKMNLHTSSTSTLTELTRALNDSQLPNPYIKYQCYLDHLDHETFEKQFFNSEDSNPDFSTLQDIENAIQTTCSRINQLRAEIQKQQAPVYRSRSTPDKYALRSYWNKLEEKRRLNAELLPLMDKLVRQKDELAQQKKDNLALQFDRLSHQIIYDKALWIPYSEESPIGLDEDLEGLSKENNQASSVDDVIFKAMLVFHQMHHLCRDCSSDCGISLNYNNVTMVIPASEEGQPEHIFLDGDHRNKDAKKIRFQHAAEHLKVKVQSLATNSVSSGKAFHFVDDQYAQTVLDFFKKHPQLIPPGITLHCYYYNYNDHVIRQQSVDSIFKTIGSVSNHLTADAVKGSFFDRSPAHEDAVRNECAKTLNGLIHCVS